MNIKVQHFLIYDRKNFEDVWRIIAYKNTIKFQGQLVNYVFNNVKFLSHLYEAIELSCFNALKSNIKLNDNFINIIIELFADYKKRGFTVPFFMLDDFK